LGCRGGSIADALAASPDFGITRLVQADISSAMAARRIDFILIQRLFVMKNYCHFVAKVLILY
jgi:hypothetical protein